MKKIYAIRTNLQEPVWGRLTRSNSLTALLQGASEGFTLRHGSHSGGREITSIVSETGIYENKAAKGTPSLLVDAEDICRMSEGDIVLAGMNGAISFLYEVGHPQNIIFVTNRCNLKCVMCPQPPQKDEESGHVAENIKLIGLMNPKKTPHITLTGGEPTLNKQVFLSLLRECKQKLPATPVMVLTNGKKFSNLDFVKELTLLKHPSISFAIPLYSDIDDLHDAIVGVPGSFYEVIKALHNMALFRHNIEIRTVVHAGTMGRLPNLARYIYRNLPFVSHVTIMGLEATGDARANISDLWIDPYETVSPIMEAARILGRGGVHFSLYNYQLCVLPDSLRPYSRRSISTWKNTYIDVCQTCGKKDKCCGFFETGLPYYSKHLKPLKSKGQLIDFLGIKE